MALNRCVLVGLAVALAGVQARGDDALPSAEYIIKQEQPTLGTNIPRRVSEASEIPINRTYAQLTKEEQQLVKSQYEAMADGDEPPFPVAGLKPIYVAITKVHREVMERGELSMHADIDAGGNVTGVAVYHSPDPKITRAAANILVLTKFKPAVCGGAPCKMGFPLRIVFKVDL